MDSSIYFFVEPENPGENYKENEEEEVEERVLSGQHLIPSAELL